MFPDTTEKFTAVRQILSEMACTGFHQHSPIVPETRVDENRESENIVKKPTIFIPLFFIERRKSKNAEWRRAGIVCTGVMDIPVATNHKPDVHLSAAPPGVVFQQTTQLPSGSANTGMSVTGMIITELMHRRRPVQGVSQPTIFAQFIFFPALRGSFLATSRHPLTSQCAQCFCQGQVAADPVIAPSRRSPPVRGLP